MNFTNTDCVKTEYLGVWYKVIWDRGWEERWRERRQVKFQVSEHARLQINPIQNKIIHEMYRKSTNEFH